MKGEPKVVLIQHKNFGTDEWYYTVKQTQNTVVPKLYESLTEKQVEELMEVGMSVKIVEA